MSRRTHPCLACPGRTRHRAICGPCRRRGVRVVGDEIFVPFRFAPVKQVRLASPADPAAPTVAELQAGIDLTGYLR